MARNEPSLCNVMSEMGQVEAFVAQAKAALAQGDLSTIEFEMHRAQRSLAAAARMLRGATPEYVAGRARCLRLDQEDFAVLSGPEAASEYRRRWVARGT